MIKPRYVDTTKASIGFVLFLTFGFVWTSFHNDAPFTAYMEGLILAFGIITGKRLWQTWRGKGRGFTPNSPKGDDDNLSPCDPKGG